jgi:hypothetical protein
MAWQDTERKDPAIDEQGCLRMNMTQYFSVIFQQE